MTNRTNILSFAVVLAGIGGALATSVQSQIGPPKAFAALQPTSPGTSQSGHLNVSGNVRAGAFIGSGSGLANIPWSSLTGVPGTVLTLPFSTTADVPTLACFDIRNSTASSNTAAVAGRHQGEHGPMYGVHGTSLSDEGRGVFGAAINGDATASFGVYGLAYANGGTGVYGESPMQGVKGVATATGGTGTVGVGAGTNSRGVYGEADGSNAKGVHGRSDGYGVFGEGIGSGVGVLATSQNGRGVSAYSTNLYGVVAWSDNSVGVYAHGGPNGIYASADGPGSTGIITESMGDGVAANGANGTGVYGQGGTNGVGGQTGNVSGSGVFGENIGGGFGVFGLSNKTAVQGSMQGEGTLLDAAVFGKAFASTGFQAGVAGQTYSPDGWGVLSWGKFAASGTKSFLIDHPLDPENKFLMHYCAEGPEPLNVYTGDIVTDSKGYAVVQLPDYYTAINRDGRVQLTIEDDSDDFVLAKTTRGIVDGAFTVRTSKGGVKVNWEVKAVRNDRFVQQRGAPVEKNKPAEMRGKYVDPSLYGLDRTYGITYDPRDALVATPNRKNRPLMPVRPARPDVKKR